MIKELVTKVLPGFLVEEVVPGAIKVGAFLVREIPGFVKEVVPGIIKAGVSLVRESKKPLIMLAAGTCAASFLGQKVMDNDYSATADLGFAKFSLTKNSKTKS